MGMEPVFKELGGGDGVHKTVVVRRKKEENSHHTLT